MNDIEAAHMNRKTALLTASIESLLRGQVMVVAMTALTDVLAHVIASQQDKGDDAMEFLSTYASNAMRKRLAAHLKARRAT